MNPPGHWMRTWNLGNGYLAIAVAGLLMVSLSGCGTPEPEVSAASESQQQTQADSSGDEATAQGTTAADDNGTSSAEPKFDWGKLTEAGDVTEQVLPYFENQQIDFGTRKISTSKAVKLVNAELVSGKLVLSFQMTQPKQRVQFEGFGGDHGTYRPQRNQPRSVRMKGASHEERFVFPGLLAVGVPHPQPDKVHVAVAKVPSIYESLRESVKEDRQRRAQEEAERARMAAQQAVARSSAPKPAPKPTPPPAPKSKTELPGPGSGYTPRSKQFAELAAVTSNMYRMPGRNTFQDFGRAQRETAEVAARYPDPDLQKYGQKMLDRMKDDQNIDLQAVRRDLLARAEQLSRKTLEYGSVKSTYTDSDGSTRSVFASGNEPDYDAQRQGERLAALAHQSDAELREYVKQQRNQNSWGDLFAGDGITNNVGHLYQNIIRGSYGIVMKEARQAAGPKSATSLVTVSRPMLTTLQMRNTSGKQLTDVVVDISWNYSLSDKIANYDRTGLFFFIPIWKPGEEVDLPKFELEEPSVIHVEVDVYANEASSEDHRASFVDPQHAPNNKPGTLVFHVVRGLSGLGKAPFKGSVWVLIDDKRFDWKEGEDVLQVPVDVGEHKVVVHVRERGKRPRVAYDKPVIIDGEQKKWVELNF